jgi:hypothetical protein
LAMWQTTSVSDGLAEISNITIPYSWSSQNIIPAFHHSSHLFSAPMHTYLP